MTNSLNGWSKDGVTLFRLPYTLYRTEAELLWSMDMESNAEDLFVNEIS